MDPLFAYAYLNARIMPLERGEWYEDPLQEAFEENGFGEVTGGGTGQMETGEIEYCGIDLDLFDVEEGIPFVCQFLSECGAPKGSRLQFERDGESVEIPFGEMEGLALYLNGTELPDEVYQSCDINDLVAEINNRLENVGAMMGHWQGPTETALYLYGVSAEQMRTALGTLLAEHPLCQKSRLVTIA